MMIAQSVRERLDSLRRRGTATLYPVRPKVSVGCATCGTMVGAERVFDAIAARVRGRGIDLQVARTGCTGHCAEEPLVHVELPGRPRVTYRRVTPELGEDLVDAAARGELPADGVLQSLAEEENPLDRSVHVWGPPDRTLAGPHPFYARQQRLTLRNCGLVDPRSLEEYLARGGYRALEQALAGMTPEQVIDAVKGSGLRGRGGAGFPTGLKWSFCRAAAGTPKYVICNADEGNCGSYMDRVILEGDPYGVLEGMTLGAYAIGARHGYVYVRTEYPLVVELLGEAIGQALKAGLLGDGILGSGFSFDVKIKIGAGAYVCGEETALISSIEGEAGEPRLRPPFPAQAGLWGKPTNVNNVKTWAAVPAIVMRGGDWYAAIGNEKSKGTMVFSLAGAIVHPGIVEVPLGTPLREVIAIGGGVPAGHTLKGAQTGGPGGGIVPAALLDLPLDFEHLNQAGSAMGSGGIIVLDESVCIVDMVRDFLAFFAAESCGKCTPCREGTTQLLHIVDEIIAGRGKPADLAQLERLSRILVSTSFCGLGQAAPNPLLSSLRHFRDEWDAHLAGKCPASKCPAGTCREEESR
jgi:NADH:ubiquinone oxidoreductase subunit F (NADH-binding)/(2Fe-2S) ferredoxin